MTANAKRGLVLLAALATPWAAAQAERDVKQRPDPVIQIAILLDTSGSMQGLIRQAQTQLWTVVNEFATAKQDGRTPVLQVALYQYGSGALPAKDGYLRRVLPLTTDLDKVSEELFALRVTGSQEYCGQVIKAATDGLTWSRSKTDLKAIFIAGNEPFTQGKVDYRQACKAAITKGITVNTIYCGPHQVGIDGKWQDGAHLADGKYMHIDQNKKVAHVPAPQDKEIARLNAELNKTYLAYGARGRTGAANQLKQDVNALSASPAGSVQRVVAKASPQYRNTSWDLVDAVRDNHIKLEEVEAKDLPTDMQKMSPEERKAHVEAKQAERTRLQKQIRELSEQRKKHVAEQLKKRSNQGDNTLDAAIVTVVREQAARLGFGFE